MRDWTRLVRERMMRDGAMPVLSEEVTAELAGHLEDRYEALRTEGANEYEATERAIAEMGSPRQLARAIRRAQAPIGGLNDRTRQLWLPGLASLTAANLLLMVFSSAYQHPRLLAERSTAWFPGLALMVAYLPWVAAQPLVGALGAWLSHRAGGGRGMRLCAGLFPSIVMLGCWGLFIPATAAMEKHTWALSHPAYIAMGAILWVAPAMMGLFLGSLPFLEIHHFGETTSGPACPTRT